MDPKDSIGLSYSKLKTLEADWDNGCMETGMVILNCLTPGKMADMLISQNGGVFL